MADFRTATILDEETGLYFVELYYPIDAKKPIVRTKPIYISIKDGEEAAQRLMQNALPNQAVKKTTLQ